MTDPRTLPKFGSANNPFHSRSNAKPAAGAATVPSTEKVEKACNLPGPPSCAGIKKTDERPSQPSPAMPANYAGEPTSARSTAPISPPRGLAKKFLKLFEPRVRAGKSGVPRLAKQPIQAELTLDNIRVVRNDLSDTDLEVVAKTAAAPEHMGRSSSPSPTQSNTPAMKDEPVECRTENKTGWKPVLQT